MITLATAGFAVISQAPAMAVGDCQTVGNFVRPCIDYGGGSTVRADFYLLQPRDSSRYYYRVWIVINGTEHSKTPEQRAFGAVGRHCCWTHPVASLPPRAKEAFTRIRVYTSSGVYHYTADSPLIRFVA